MDAATGFLIAAMVIVPLAMLVGGIHLVKTNLTAMDMWMKFPLIGKMARLARNPARAPNAKWFQSERELCEDYHKFIGNKDRFSFDEQREHMRLAGDSGRRETPFYLIPILFILLIAESFGFSLLLGDLMTGSAGTARETSLAGLGIVLVLAIILLFLTHQLGHNFEKTRLKRACLKESKLHGSHVRTTTVDLSKQQSVDQNEPDFVRCTNRITKGVGDSGSYMGPAVLWAVIVAFAIGMVMLRMYQLDIQLTEQTAGAVVDSGDPFASSGLPAELTGPQAQADGKVATELNESRKSEGLVAYIILSMIFLLTQSMGFWIGMKYGFLSEHAKNYDPVVVKFPSYERYREFLSPFVNLASQRLVELQSMMPANEVARRENGRTQANTFEDFCREKLIQSEEVLNGGSGTKPMAAVVAAPAVAAPAPVAIDPIQEAKDMMNSMNDATREREYFLSLPPELKAHPELQAWLKNRKQQREEAQKQVNVDDLF
jgi:hypothetical protein